MTQQEAAAPAAHAARGQGGGVSDGLLIGFAILRANWDRNEQTFVDNFIPFVADCLRDVREGETVSPGEVRACVLKRYGIELPHLALKTILNRAVRRGLADRRNNKYAPKPEALKGAPLARRREDVAREIESLISRLVVHVSERHGEDWSRDRAESALRNFVENWSVPLLRQSLGGFAAEGSWLEQRETDYLIGGFVLELREQDPDGFRYLESLVKGSMLTAGLYLDQGRFDQQFTQLTAYLDSPFLLSLLGVHGEEEGAAAKEMMQLAKELGVETACFADTLSEVRGVIQGTARDMRDRRRRGGQRRLHSRVVTAGLSASQLDELADRAEEILAKFGIGLRARPTTSAAATDLAVLSDLLQEHIGYLSDTTRDHDMKCLAAINEIRKGQVQVQLERARAIFITSNPKVVAAAAQHFCSPRDPLQVPVAMMDHEFATLLWLKKPTAAPDLPWKQLIADCHAALNPDDGLWNRYLDEIEELAERDDIDEQTYYLVRHGNEARSALMDRTRGRSDKLDQRSVHEIVEHAKHTISAPEKARAEDAERRAGEAEARARAEQARAMAAVEQEREAGQRAAQAADRRARAETAADAAQSVAERLARVVARVVYGLAVAAVVIAVFGFVSMSLDWSVPRWVSILSSLILGAGAAASTLFKVSVPQLVHRLEVGVASSLRRRLEPVFAPSRTEDRAPTTRQNDDQDTPGSIAA
jgi:hypothetical protein